MKVEIGFDLAANGVGNWFTLDDPVKGKLDNTTYKLAGEVLVDVTDVTRSVTVKRGRSRALEKFTAGIASATLDNRDRAFDPLNPASPYYGSIVPRKQFRISVDGTYLFIGNVEDYDWAYSVEGDATATCLAVDGFAYLAGALIPAGTAVGTTPGARIGTVLNEAGWPTATRQLSTGNVTLDLDVIPEDTEALAYIQKVEQSEPGAFFISRDGYATFLSRTDLQDASTGGVAFGPTGVPFVEYDAASVTTEMKNTVAVTWYAGTVVGGTATAVNTTSVAAYGEFPYELDTLVDSESQAQVIADWLVNQYGQPQYRVDSVTVALHALPSAAVGSVLGLDLGDNVTVNWTPNNVGSAISQVVTIDGIEHQANPAEHFVTFTLSQSIAAFTLDDSVYGVLNSNVLGF